MARTISPPGTLAYAGALVGVAPLTLACWFNPNDISDRSLVSILNTGAPSDNAFVLHTSSGDTLVHASVANGGGGTGSAASGGTVTTGAWHHAAATFFSTTSRNAWLNGVGGATDTTACANPTGPNQAGLSAGGLGQTYFNGAIAEAAIWDVALTAAEIATLARGVSPLLVRPGSLLAYWPVYGTQSPEPDLKGAAALTITGTATAAAHPRVYMPTRARLVRGTPVPPAAFTYISPANGATAQIAPVTLSWHAAAGATGYDVYFGTAATPVTLVSSNQAGTTYAATTAIGVTYYWQIVARNVTGTTPGAIWHFAMLDAPPMPSGENPADGSIMVPGSTSLTWFRDALSTAYDLSFGTVDPPPLVEADYPYAYYPSPDVHENTIHYWRVKAKNGAGETLGPLWTFRIAPGPVFVAARTLEAVPGPGYRARLIQEGKNVGTWPLAELARLQARDISGNNYHGAYVGTGFTTIAFDVPEGCLGTTFDGNGYVNVPERTPADPSFTLSLAYGDVDHAILIRGYVADGVKRAIIAKHDGARATGNGWYLAIQSGVLEWSLIVSGTIVYRFSRGLIDDGEHLITLNYQAALHEAWIAIDGAIVLPKETGLAGTEGLPTSAALRIGHFCDGAAGDGLGFVGSLAYVMAGRLGDPDLGPELEALRAWTDLTPHVRAATPITTRTGIPGNGPSDNVATTGTLNFVLDNGYRVDVGYYTPGHPLVREGWGIGTAIRLSFAFGGLTYYEFLGRLSAVTPIAGYQGTREADCLAVDWMDVAAGTPLSALEALLNKGAGYVVGAVLDQAQGRAPAAVQIATGAGVWPFAIESGESEYDTLITELSRIMTSERGFAYIRGDTTRGGLFVFEGHPDRVGLPVVAEFDNTMQGLDVAYALDALVNIVRITYTPRKVDGSVVTLYALDISQHAEPILAGETRVFEGGYVDPSNLAERVGGTQLVALVAGTDIAFNAAANGAGANLNAYLAMTQRLGGNSYRLELTNTHATTTGYLYLNSTTGFQIRGKGIYHYKPVTIERRDNDSVRMRGPRPLDIDLGYESDGAVAAALAAYYLELYGVEQPIPSSLRIVGNRDATMMRYALGLQPGHKIALGEPMTGLVIASSFFIVHEKRIEYTEPGILIATFTLAPAPVSLLLRRRLPPEVGSA